MTIHFNKLNWHWNLKELWELKLLMIKSYIE